MGSFHIWALSQTRPTIHDLALIPFPIIDPAYGTDSIDAPIDGVLACLTTAAKNLPASEALMEFIGSTTFSWQQFRRSAPGLSLKQACSTVPADPFIQSQVKLVQATKHVAQYFDRDSRPDFASPIFSSCAAEVLDRRRPKGHCGKPREAMGCSTSSLSEVRSVLTCEPPLGEVFSPAEVPFSYCM
jgi:hypothetical protein